MAFSKEQIISFTCPRYSDLPSLSLYMDQVLIILDEAIGIFYSKKEKPITSAMINNYVKLKLLKPPIKKKYDREHIAFLIVVSILKKALSISEIAGVLGSLISDSSLETTYNQFCDELEFSLRHTFADETAGISTQAPPILKAALNSLMGKLMVQACLQQQ